MAVTERARRLGWPTRMVLVGTLIRLVLIPITNGPDFEVWDIASKATLRGQNIYANHPDGYPGGPFAYLPLFLYLELPFQWISMHTGIAFRTLGKLPILVGDLVVAVAIITELRRRACTVRIQTIGAALWLLNPLLLYNSAWYGRFDSVCVALLMLALVSRRRTGEDAIRATDRSSLLIGAAIATKLFPVVVVPWLVWRSQRRVRTMAIIVGVCVLVALPYLVGSAGALIDDVVRYNSDKPPNGLTWQTALRFGGASDETMKLVRNAMIVASAVVLWLLRNRSSWTFTTVAICCFVLTSNIVLEQYMVWPIPFAIVLALSTRSGAAMFLVVWTTVAGAIMNHDIHPLGVQGSEATVWFNVTLAAGLIAGLAMLVIGDRDSRTRDRDRDRDRASGVAGSSAPIQV